MSFPVYARVLLAMLGIEGWRTAVTSPKFKLKRITCIRCWPDLKFRDYEKE